MDIVITTISGTVFKRDGVEYVELPTVVGEIGVYPHHEKLLTRLARGRVIVRVKGGEVQQFVIADGIAEIHENKVHLYTDVAEPRVEYIREKIEEAIQEARKEAVSSDITVKDRLRAERLLAIEEARLKAVSRSGSNQ